MLDVDAFFSDHGKTWFHITCVTCGIADFSHLKDYCKAAGNNATAKAFTLAKSKSCYTMCGTIGLTFGSALFIFNLHWIKAAGISFACTYSKTHGTKA